MAIKRELYQSKVYFNLQLLASQIVEGTITGIHKSPFHGFSSEFAEHKVYNPGDSTRHIDWKLFARTDKLFTKRYEEETNMRCHLILDNSASMHYPRVKNFHVSNLNKIGFSVLASAVLMQLLKKQRDAVGLSIYGATYDFYTNEKGSERHFNLIYNQLESIVYSKPKQEDTNTVKIIHQIAEKLHKRSVVFFFTDMFQYCANKEELFEALRHIKYNKHEVVLFHTLDYNTEVSFNFDTAPKSFIDVETNEKIDLYADNIKELYKKKITTFINEIQMECAKYKIKYVPVNTESGFEKIINTYLVEKQQFG